MSIFYFKFFKKFMKENEKGISGTLPGLQRKGKSGGRADLFVYFSGCDNFPERLYCNTEEKNKKGMIRL